MISLLLIVPFIIPAIIILIFVGMKTKSKEEGEDFMRNIYVYLVLFATLMMVIGGSVGAFMAGADIVSPAPYYQSLDEYSQWNEGDKVVDKAELKEKYDAMVESNKEQATQRSINTLIKSFGWILIPLPIFIYFQRRLEKKEKSLL